MSDDWPFPTLPARPHITVRLIDGLHTPCLIAVTRQGHTQVADTRPGSEDPVEAKRDAVRWAFSKNLLYVVPK